MTELKVLKREISQCRLCEDEFEHTPRPVFQLSTHSKIVIAGQAPGSKVHETGIPFNDPSGVRLRQWMGVNEDTFYDSRKVAILPMAFCYPGKGRSGDLPPPPRCAQTWRDQVFSHVEDSSLILLIGKYANDWHLGARNSGTLTELIKHQDLDQNMISLPHPSPRNNIWLKKNAWFEQEVIPKFQLKIHRALHNGY